MRCTDTVWKSSNESIMDGGMEEVVLGKDESSLKTFDLGDTMEDRTRHRRQSYYQMYDVVLCCTLPCPVRACIDLTGYRPTLVRVLPGGRRASSARSGIIQVSALVRSRSRTRSCPDGGSPSRFAIESMPERMRGRIQPYRMRSRERRVQQTRLPRVSQR